MKIEKHGNQFRVRKSYKGIKYTLNFDHIPTRIEVNEQLICEINKSLNAPILTDKQSFEKLALKYINSKSNVLSPSTIDGYTKELRKVPSWFRELNINKINTSEVQTIINEYALGHAPKSVYNYHGFVAAVLRFYIPNIQLKVRLPQKQVKEEYIPTDSDIEKLLEESINTRYYVPLLLGCYGLRRSEILALTQEDLNGTILTVNKAYVKGPDNIWTTRMNTKNCSSTRKVYLSEYVAEQIRNRGLYHGSPESISEYIGKVCKKLNIPHFSLHKLRHYFATSMPLPEADILKMGGWSKSNTSVMKIIYKHSRLDTDGQLQERAKSAYSSVKYLSEPSKKPVGTPDTQFGQHLDNISDNDQLQLKNSSNIDSEKSSIQAISYSTTSGPGGIRTPVRNNIDTDYSEFLDNFWTILL